MIIQIRPNTFETNSSSTHSLCIATAEEFEKWKNGEIFYSIYDEEFYTKEEVEKIVQQGIEHYRKLKKELEEKGEKISSWIEDYCASIDLQKVIEGDEEEIEHFMLHSTILPYKAFFYYNQFETFCRKYCTEKGHENFVVFGCDGYDG